MNLKLRRQGGPWGYVSSPWMVMTSCMSSRSSCPGRLKNSRSRVSPIYETIESESKERLETLRIELIGAEGRPRCCRG